MYKKLLLFAGITFLFLDLIVLNVALLLSSSDVRMSSNREQSSTIIIWWSMLNISWLVSSWLNRVYTGKSTRRLIAFCKHTVKAYLAFVVLILGSYILSYRYLDQNMGFYTTLTTVVLLYVPVLIAANRIIYSLAWAYFKKKQRLTRRVLIIGYNDIGKKLADYFEHNNAYVQLVGFCEETSNVTELSHYPILSRPINAIVTSKKHKISEIYSTILPEQDNRIYDLMHLADQACIRFKLVPDFRHFVKQPVHIKYIDGMPILTVRPEPLENLVNRINKRLFDILISTFAIIFIMSWLVPLVGLAIWLESRGSIFFIQKRSGLNNEPFSCIKFRSMHTNADANLRQATRNDQRLTRVGKFLRKTNLDEFPQFFNVLLGEMSIVGPRPHMLKHTEDYSAIIKKYMVRQFLKPGITGWAQANGLRGETRKVEEMEARVNYDIWYMERWSLLLDLKILMLTGYNMIKGNKDAF